MCILFSYISRRVNPNEFKFILLSNRDEYHHRASKPASFVNGKSIYGVDLTSGKEGGTWFGANRSGKVAALINLNKEDYGFDQNKGGRGFLVADYLNGSMDIATYTESIKAKAQSYNPFNLLLYEKNKNDLFDCTIFNNIDCTPINSPDIMAVSNHLFNSPYPKTSSGRDIFSEIVSKFNQLDNKQQLVNNLLKLAKNDAGLKFENYMKDDLKSANLMMRKQVFIDVPFYGTRTHTIILVDDKNRVTFYEQTMKCPIDSNHPEWIENTHEFDLTD